MRKIVCPKFYSFSPSKWKVTESQASVEASGSTAFGWWLFLPYYYEVNFFQTSDSQLLPARSMPQPNFLLDCSLPARQIKMPLVTKVSIPLLLCTRKYARVGICPSSHLSKSCWIGLRKYHLFHKSFTKWNAAGSVWTLSLLKLSLVHWKVSFLLCGMRPWLS